MRRTLAKDLSRNKNRIKSFLYFHGIDMPEALNKSATHLSKRFMNWLRSIEFTESSAKKSLSLLINESQHLRLTMLDAIRGIRELAQS